MDYLQNLVAAHAMEVSAVILVITYFFIATELISKVTVALLGAGLSVVFGLVSQQKFSGGVLNNAYFANFVDFNVIFLLLSMMIIVSVTARSGIFNLLANWTFSFTKGKPIRLMFCLGAFTAFVSAFLDNVTTVILVMPMTFAIARKIGITPVPFLLMEIFSSNIGGTATLIGDPPNIIIGSAANFSFLDFLNELSGVIVVIFIVVAAMMIFFFRRELRAGALSGNKQIELGKSKVKINKPLAIRSLTVLALVIFGFLLRDFIGIESCVVALIGASVLLIFEKPAEIFKDVEWSTIFFFIGLFIIIGGLESSGAIKLMSQWLLEATKGNQAVTSMAVLWVSGIVSGIIDNIPYTATMAPLISEIESTMGKGYALPLWWCLSLGACLGGNFTIIGAAANVIVSESASKEGHPISFMYFFKFGIIIVFVSLLISTAYVYLRFL